MPSGQSVTIFSCRIPCAIAGAGKLEAAPVANDPAPARISRRLMAAPFISSGSSRRSVGYGVDSSDHARRFAITIRVICMLVWETLPRCRWTVTALEAQKADVSTLEGLESRGTRAAAARILRDQRLRHPGRRRGHLRISPSRRSARTDRCPRAASRQLDGNLACGRSPHRVGACSARRHDDEGA